VLRPFGPDDFESPRTAASPPTSASPTRGTGARAAPWRSIASPWYSCGPRDPRRQRIGIVPAPPRPQRTFGALTWLACAVSSLLFVAPRTVDGQEAARTDSTARAAPQTVGTTAYFYRNRPGSDQYLGPLDVLLNKGFNLAQAENRDRRIFRARYGVRHVRNSLLHPFASIGNTGGWSNFLQEQILPVEAAKWIRSGFDWDAADNMTWYPNYFGHFVEGGITSRGLAEKLRAQGVPAAGVVAGATTMAAAMLNEMYTHPDLVEGTGGTVADLYVFDLGGVILFSLDPVARFFSETLHAAVWPSQASLTLPDLELANNANNLVFKIPIPWVDRASLFVRTAVGSHVGPTLHFDGGYDLSVGIGADTSRQNIDPLTGGETVDLRLSSSVYLDRDGSVLAALYVSAVDHRLIALNVFPGVLHRDFGGWINVSQDGALAFGLTHRLALGLGLGAGFGG
jgi:hypothetical protein